MEFILQVSITRNLCVLFPSPQLITCMFFLSILGLISRKTIGQYRSCRIHTNVICHIIVIFPSTSRSSKWSLSSRFPLPETCVYFSPLHNLSHACSSSVSLAWSAERRLVSTGHAEFIQVWFALRTMARLLRLLAFRPRFWRQQWRVLHGLCSAPGHTLLGAVYQRMLWVYFSPRNLYKPSEPSDTLLPVFADTSLSLTVVTPEGCLYFIMSGK